MSGDREDDGQGVGRRRRRSHSCIQIWVLSFASRANVGWNQRIACLGSMQLRGQRHQTCQSQLVTEWATVRVLLPNLPHFQGIKMNRFRSCLHSTWVTAVSWVSLCLAWPGAGKLPEGYTAYFFLHQYRRCSAVHGSLNCSSHSSDKDTGNFPQNKGNCRPVCVELVWSQKGDKTYLVSINLRKNSLKKNHKALNSSFSKMIQFMWSKTWDSPYFLRKRGHPGSNWSYLNRTQNTQQACELWNEMWL